MKRKSGNNGEALVAAAAVEELVEQTRTGHIELPVQKIGRLKVTIRGVTRLVVHNFGEKARKQMEAPTLGKARMKKPPRDPEQEFRDSLYTFPDKPGQYFAPGRWFKKAMVRACKAEDGIAMTDARQYLRVLDEWIPIVGSEPQMRTDVVRLESGVATLRYRPEFLTWKCTFHVLYNPNFFSLEKVVNVISLAGMWGGVGEDRPEKTGGDWGLFEIENVEART